MNNKQRYAILQRNKKEWLKYYDLKEESGIYILTRYDDNPISRAQQLHGSLLICHGLADDNVHPQNTFEYTEALVQADKDFKMNIYTNRNHSIFGGNTRNHLLRQITEFFKEKMQ